MYRTKNLRGAILTKGTIAVFSLFAMLMMSATTFSVPAYGATTKLDNSQFQLEVTPLAPKLPADGGTYYAVIQLEAVDNDDPIAAPYDLDIAIVSSDPSVLTGQESVTLKEGESMVNAEITTTKKAGEVSISAQAEGVASDSVTIFTMPLDSQEPAKLVLYSAPKAFVPDPKFGGMIYVQLLNSQNIPTVTKNSMTITLSSSKPEIGSIPSYVTISGGQSGAVVNFTPKYEIGTTRISASSTGVAPALLDVKTDGPLGSKLVVEFGPPTIPSSSGYTTIMTVQLRDENDVPVKAAQPILVSLRSSDKLVAELPFSTEIKAGESYAKVNVKSHGAEGSTIITATSAGLESGIATLNSVPASEMSSIEDRGIILYTVPSILPPDNSEHSSIIIAFVDSSGRPVLAGQTQFQRVALSSSDSTIGTTVSTGYVTHSFFAEAKFKTTYSTGETIITAVASDFSPAQVELIVDGAAPAALALTQVPGIVEAKISERPNLVVSLVDLDGKPVLATQDVNVFLSSSESDVATVQASAMIPAGQAYAILQTKSTDKAGESTITATAGDLASGNIQFKTTGYAGSISQYSFGLYTVPRIAADGKEHDVVFVQLQDQTGSPVPAKSDIPVMLSSSSALSGTVQRETTILAGNTFAMAKFTSGRVADDDMKITASSPGFVSVESVMETTLQPLQIKITNALPKNADFEQNEIFVEVEVKAGIFPAKGAVVELGGPQSDPTFITTDANGLAGGMYVSAKPGPNSIEAKATLPGFKEAVAKANVAFSQNVDLIVKAVSQGGTDIGAQFKIGLLNSAAKSYTSTESKPVTLTKQKWGTYRITAPEEFTSAEGKFKFVSWSDGRTDNPRSIDVYSDVEVSAVYSAQFLVQVTSDYGRTTGTGYYNEGDIANISIDTTPVGSGIIDKTFGGWSGDISTSAQGAQVKVDGPKVIKAEWQDSYLKLALIIGALAAGGGIAYMKVLKPRKEAIEKTRAPDLDWYKS